MDLDFGHPVNAYEALAKGGAERGSYLRRKGLYSSHICEWRKQRDAGTLAGATRGRRAKRSRSEAELDKLRARNARLEAELDRTRLALEITGKAHALLELISESADTETRLKP